MYTSHLSQATSDTQLLKSIATSIVRNQPNQFYCGLAHDSSIYSPIQFIRTQPLEATRHFPDWNLSQNTPPNNLNPLALKDQSNLYSIRFFTGLDWSAVTYMWALIRCLLFPTTNLCIQRIVQQPRANGLSKLFIWQLIPSFQRALPDYQRFPSASSQFRPSLKISLSVAI